MIEKGGYNMVAKCLNKKGIIAFLIAAIFSSVTLVGGYAWAAGDASSKVQHLKGWSVKKSLMGKDVFNDRNEKIGSIDDVFVTTDKHVTYMVIGVGGFLGLGDHPVAVSAKDIKLRDGKLFFPGGSKDELKRMPKFEYTDYNKSNK